MAGPDSRLFAGVEYIEAMKKHYPDWAKPGRHACDVVPRWLSAINILGKDPVDRFMPLDKRHITQRKNAWEMTTTGMVGRSQRWIGASRTYKGLAFLKPPFDVMLYSSLIWELQPKTIIEFGSMMGGSALWYADQLDCQVGSGEVHSFELFVKAIHPRAKHPRLHFHKCDLSKIKTLDRALFDRLPHPWLVIDDAHCNLEELGPLVASMMKVGDYYVWEDVFMAAWSTIAKWQEAVTLTKKHGLMVDSKYADAFGYNVTASPNAWFKKVR